MRQASAVHSSDWSADDIQARVAELGDWFHNFHLGGVQTAPNHFLGDYPAVKWRRFAHAIPPDLRGKTVLDVGCNAGFYSLEMKRRGADRVLGIDSDERYLAQARFAAEFHGLDIEYRRLSVYDVPSLHESFDVVIFMGVLYHLRHPLLALDILGGGVARELLVVQSMIRGSSEIPPIGEDYEFEDRAVFERPGFPAMYFVEHRYAGDPTNWWVPNRACLEAMFRSAGLQIVARPEPEVYLCKPRPAAEGEAAL
jgi:tRNA (mo5U34)-methyltransferase